MRAKPVYLDYQATTPLDPRAAEAMAPYWSAEFGNPHSDGHSFGWDARAAVTAARAEVAALIGADDDEMVFTSGATESCNLAIRGVAHGWAGSNDRRKKIITVATEHPAVLETVQWLGAHGFEAVVLPVDGQGLLDLAALDAALDARTFRFGPATSWSGFTPTGVSGFNDLQPGVVVRELLQNALDAAVAAGEPTAIVHFAVRTVRTADIPGCAEYRDALGSAVESQTRRSVNGALPDNAQQVVDTITAALDRDTCSVLVILDNGIGLDATSMDALLSDGTSAKQDAATGSYGNGHMVAIPASDLRYVLYGGDREEGFRVG